MRAVGAVLVCCAVTATAGRADAAPVESAAARDPLDALYDAVARDLAAGKPLVVEAHVALCDNSIIRCGGRGLGDGDDLARNLYWATDGGLRGWLERRGSPWRRVARSGRDGDILETVVYERRVAAAGAWAARGVTAPFAVRFVAHAWRGRSIDRALDRFVHDLVDDHVDARIVAYVGHNGWMDRDTLVWPRTSSRRSKGFIAVACLTRDYLLAPLASATQVPLLLTRELLFAGSHALDGAIAAFAAGGTRSDIRRAASRAYADGESKPLARVQRLFTN